jgi:hypothetical protein
VRSWRRQWAELPARARDAPLETAREPDHPAGADRTP